MYGAEARGRGDMTRTRFALGCVVLAVTGALPTGAGASTKWVCVVPGEGVVTFVTAADAARHGINTANSKAGVVFHDRFGEVCHVE
jgi:hypothetical protein